MKSFSICLLFFIGLVACNSQQQGVNELHEAYLNQRISDMAATVTQKGRFPADELKRIDLEKQLKKIDEQQAFSETDVDSLLIDQALQEKIQILAAKAQTKVDWSLLKIAIADAYIEQVMNDQYKFYRVKPLAIRKDESHYDIYLTAQAIQLPHVYVKEKDKVVKAKTIRRSMNPFQVDLNQVESENINPTASQKLMNASDAFGAFMISSHVGDEVMLIKKEDVIDLTK
ncbi:MAG: hypothetical protein ACPGJS_01400 [Flammeovirgaceae bacterium]